MDYKLQTAKFIEETSNYLAAIVVPYHPELIKMLKDAKNSEGETDAKSPDNNLTATRELDKPSKLEKL